MAVVAVVIRAVVASFSVSYTGRCSLESMAWSTFG